MAGPATSPLTRPGRRLAEAVAGVPAGRTDYVVLRDLRTPMRDGAELLGDLYRPRGDDPAPVVLIRTPYGRATLGSRLFAIVLAGHGFQVLLQSVRGTFGSDGVFRPFTAEHLDGLDTLAWVRQQPWCDGRVATTGASYFGHTQWAVAPYADPPLVASALHITAASISDVFYEHGVPGAMNAISWTDLIARQEVPGITGRIRRSGRNGRALRALATRPLREADVAVTGERVPFWRDITGHAEPDDPFWAVADHDAAPLDRMPPVSMVTGWWDLFLQAQLHDVARLQAAGVPVRVTVGPWLHGSGPEIRELLRSDLVWLEHHLHGGPAPAGPPVRLQLQQTDEWLAFATWPPPGTAPDVRYLTAGDRLSSTAPAEPEASSQFVFDPSDPTRMRGGPLLAPPGMQADDADTEAGIDVAVFTGPVEPRDLDLVGEIVAHVHVRPERERADLFVRLCDVDEQGVSRNVVEGIRRLDPRTVPADDVAIGPDGVLEVAVELFPTAYRVQAGHRLRVVVTGGAFPRFAPNPGTGAPLAETTDGTPYRLEILHDAAHPSRIVLPVLE
ncbi:CocE/NonD family hydrolase [uncultured Amnibacterium sp.]|uniref:CocE/NonD family hydrolase n=1 Tax=uncultured Amnibacterium sp. TaxID=1631851 RepID=UPI0035CACD47